MHRRLYAPLGRLLLALVALTTVAALSACSESDNRPLVVVHDPVTPVTSPANVGRVDVKVTTPNGDVTHSFTAEEVAKGDLGVYLPAGTTGTVTVVVIIYGKDGAIIATSPQVAVTVAPGKVQTTSVWQSTGDRDASTPIGPDGPLSGLDAGIDSPRTGDAVIGEVGVDIGGGVVVSDGSVDAIVSDVPLSPDGPLPVDTGLPLDLHPEPLGVDASADTTPAVPVWHLAQNVEKDQINKSYDPVVAVDPNSQDAYVGWTESSTVKVKRWNFKTQSWEATKTLETRGSGNGLALGVDGKGNVFAAWYQNSATGSDETLFGVWTTTSADGVAWSPPYHINAGSTWEMKLAVASNGTARILYSMRTTTNVDPLFSAYYDGLTWTSNSAPIYDPKDPYGFNTRLIVNASGDGYALFDMKDSGGSTSVGAAVLTGKTGVSTPVVLDELTTGGVWDRDIALNKKGTVVAVWGEYGNSSTILKSKTYNPANGWSASATSIASIDYAGSLVAVLDESDTLTLAWRQTLASNKYNTLTLRGKVNGAWDEVVPLETDNTAGDLGKEDSAPQLAIDGSGNVLVAWRKEINGPDVDSDSANTKTYAIYGSAYRDGAWQTPVSIYQKDGVVGRYPSLSVSEKGFGVVTFYAWSNTSTDPDLYNALVAFYR